MIFWIHLLVISQTFHSLFTKCVYLCSSFFLWEKTWKRIVISVAFDRFVIFRRWEYRLEKVCTLSILFPTQKCVPASIFSYCYSLIGKPHSNFLRNKSTSSKSKLVSLTFSLFTFKNSFTPCQWRYNLYCLTTFKLVTKFVILEKKIIAYIFWNEYNTIVVRCAF